MIGARRVRVWSRRAQILVQPATSTKPVTRRAALPAGSAE